MVTASRILLTPSTECEFAVSKLTQKSAERATNVLQENHEKHDIIFNNFGLHNHIVHHILTAFALGATPDELQKRYERNAAYQRPPQPLIDQVVEELHDPTKFLANLSKIQYYPSYLVFFRKEIEEKGYEHVVNEYVFKGDERANIMFARLFAGTLHPIIHLGFGIEFKQPTVIAEALGQTAIHPTYLDSFLFKADEAAKRNQHPSKSLVEILDAIRADEKLSTAAHWNDRNQIRDGVLLLAKDEMVKYASQWRVDPANLEEATAELANAAAYFTGAAQHPPKQIKFDFYFIHSVNSSIFFSSFLRQPWISAANKAKLLEYKGRMDLCQYASRGSPTLLLEEIANYVPRRQESSNWDAIFERVNKIDDDGHACKLVRALAHGERICAPWEKNERFRVREGCG